MNDFDPKSSLADQNPEISAEVAFRAAARVWPVLMGSKYRELGVQSARVLLLAAGDAMAAGAAMAAGDAMAARDAMAAGDAWGDGDDAWDAWDAGDAGDDARAWAAMVARAARAAWDAAGRARAAGDAGDAAVAAMAARDAGDAGDAAWAAADAMAAARAAWDAARDAAWDAGALGDAGDAGDDARAWEHARDAWDDARAAWDAARDAWATRDAWDDARDARAAGDAAWAAVKSDYHIIDTEGLEALRKTPLWHTAGNPLQNIWDAAQNDLRNDPDFHLWLRWYDGILKGTPLNRDMLAEIARIPSGDWEQGPEHIAGKIARIELEYVEKSTPMAERVEWVPDIQRIRITPVPMDNTALYNTVLDKLRDALSRIRPEGELRNAHAALRDILADLDQTLGTHADNPQRVHDDMETALWSIQYLIARKEIADDLAVRTLMRKLDENILDIEGAMPEVRAVVQARLALRFQRLPEEDRKILIDAADASKPLLEEERYQEDMREDAEALNDEDPNTEETKPRLYRLISRLVRIWKVAGEAAKLVAAVKAILSLLGF